VKFRKRDIGQIWKLGMAKIKIRTGAIIGWDQMDRSFFISSRMCGLIFGASRTTSCRREAWIILKTAGERSTSNGSMPFATLKNIQGIMRIVGGLLLVIGSARDFSGSMESRDDFFPFRVRGVPFGPDDGTIAPWAVVASLPFAPKIVVPALHYFNQHYPVMISKYGYKCSFNPTYPV
jgi:hypothetical protein